MSLVNEISLTQMVLNEERLTVILENEERNGVVTGFEFLEVKFPVIFEENEVVGLV